MLEGLADALPGAASAACGVAPDEAGVAGAPLSIELDGAVGATFAAVFAGRDALPGSALSVFVGTGELAGVGEIEAGEIEAAVGDEEVEGAAESFEEERLTTKRIEPDTITAAPTATAIAECGSRPPAEGAAEETARTLRAEEGVISGPGVG